MPVTEAERKRPHSNAALAMLTLVGIALFAGFIALGIWQVQRRAWKLELIERVTQRLQSPPVPLPPSTEWPGMDAARAEYLPVRLQGVWLADKTALTQATTVLGAGFWVMTPLQLAEGGQVLVNRGFIPQEQRAQWKKSAAAPAPVTIEGVVRMSEPGGGFLRRNDPVQQRWHSRDVATLAQSMQLPQAAPFFVDAGLPDRTSAALAEVTGASQGPWPRTGLTVVRFSNSHAVYALTWFGLALMVVGAAVVVARYELRLRAAHSPQPAHDQQR